jgi:type IV pilus assembly protein PilC
MAVYSYKAKKGPGEFVTGEVIAASQKEAVVKVEKMQLTPIQVVEKQDGGRVQKAKTFTPRRDAVTQTKGSFLGKVKVRNVDNFTRQLASLVKASVPILRALSLISQETENRRLKSMVEDMEARVRDGKTLSSSMGRYPHIFNNLYLSMVISGEKGGVLSEMLYKLVEYREKEEEVRRRIQAAMAYPILMILVGLATVFGMMTFFVPRLIGIFQAMAQELPVPTKILIYTSNLMSEQGWWFLVGLVLLFAVFGRVKPSSKKKFLLDFMKLKLPFLKQFVQQVEIAKFSRTLGMLLRNGLPVYESLELAISTLDNEALRSRLSQVSQEIITQGSTLSASLRQMKIFPNFAINMIAVGEEGGELEEALSEISKSYEREVDHRIKIITTLLEPLLILVIGSIVGFIVFAMLLPIFEIGVSV